MQTKEGLFDRIEQSIELFKNNFTNIFLSYFSYKLFVFITGSFLYYIVLNVIDFSKIFGNLNSIGELFSNTGFIIGISIIIILVLVNLIIIIPFILATIKTIKEAYEEKESINFVENIKYGFKNLYNSFKTYWYIFAYVALIPSIILIIGGLFLVFGQSSNLENLGLIGTKILIFGFILFILFSIYRGIKTSFSLYSAVDKNEYTKENFEKSIEITNNNWIRIVGNFLVIGIFLGIIGLIIKSIIGIFGFYGSNHLDYQQINFSKNTKIEELKEIINKVGEFNVLNFIGDFLNFVIETIFTIFMMVFSFIFYKRLELELKNNKFEEIKKEEKEL